MQTIPLFEKLCCNGVVLPAICENPQTRQQEMEQVQINDNRAQVDSLKKGKGKGKRKHQNQKDTRTNNTNNTDVNTCKNCGGTGHWVKDCWRPSGKREQHEELWQRHTFGRGANESAFRNSLNSVVSFIHVGDADFVYPPLHRGSRRVSYSNPEWTEIRQDSEGEDGWKTSEVGERDRVEVFCGKNGNM